MSETSGNLPPIDPAQAAAEQASQAAQREHALAVHEQFNEAVREQFHGGVEVHDLGEDAGHQTPEPEQAPEAAPQQEAEAAAAVQEAEPQTPDASVALSEQETTDWRQAERAEHFNDLPDSVKEHVKATGDTMEPGYMKLQRAKREASQRLAASDTYHEGELRNDSHRTGQEAHDRALEAARSEAAGKVEANYQEALRLKPGMTDQTKKLLRQGLEARFEREAVESAAAAGEAARLARVDHVNENGGASALERIRTAEDRERYMRNVLGDEEYDRRAAAKAARAARERAAADESTTTGATEAGTRNEPTGGEEAHEGESWQERMDRPDREGREMLADELRRNREYADRHQTRTPEEIEAEFDMDDEIEAAQRALRERGAGSSALDGLDEEIQARRAAAGEEGSFDPTRLRNWSEVLALSPKEFQIYLEAVQKARSENGLPRANGDSVTEPPEIEWEPVDTERSNNGGADEEDGPLLPPPLEQDDGEGEGEEQISDSERAIRAALEDLKNDERLEGVDLAKMSKRKRRDLLDSIYDSIEENGGDEAYVKAFHRLLREMLSNKDRYNYFKKSSYTWLDKDVEMAKDAMKADRKNGLTSLSGIRERISDAFRKAHINIQNYYADPEKGKRRKWVSGVVGVLALGGAIWGGIELFGGNGGGSGSAANTAAGLGTGGNGNGNKADILNNYTPAQGGGAGNTAGETMNLGHFDANNPNGDGTVSGLALKALHERGVANPTGAQIHNASNIIANANGYPGDSYTNPAMNSLADGQTFSIPQDLGQ